MLDPRQFRRVARMEDAPLTPSIKQTLKIGVGILVVQDGNLLLGKRLGTLGYGTWAPPGGHLEPGETPNETAARELAEETGIVIPAYAFAPTVFVQDNGRETQNTYLTLFVVAQTRQATPVIKEPKKCAEWRWCSFNQLPTPFFSPFEALHTLITQRAGPFKETAWKRFLNERLPPAVGDILLIPFIDPETGELLYKREQF